MKYFLWMLMATTSYTFAEPTCPRCERFREYNKQHPGKDQYYEDYLKENKTTSDKSTQKGEEEKPIQK